MKRFLSLLFCHFLIGTSVARDITFCGERIPIDNEFVAKKLMEAIRSQIKHADLPTLRREAARYFPMIEYCLKVSGMPQDLKYIPIIESGFQRDALSRAGAKGFWQLMPGTATDWNLRIEGNIDEREDIYKSTIAALRELARTFKGIRNKHNIASWVLTAAAYNWGIKNVFDKIASGSTNYFSMKLNPETASYVYKIVAIKELFEYPELYIKNFQFNVFNRNAIDPTIKNASVKPVNPAEFKKMELPVQKDGQEPDDEKIKNIAKPKESELKNKDKEEFNKDAKLISGEIVGKYRGFQDGDVIQIKLLENLQTLKGFQRKGTELSGKGWIVDDRVFIDLGFDDKNVILYDSNSEQGIPVSELKNKEQVILRVQN